MQTCSLVFLPCFILRGKVGGTCRHTLNPVCAVAVMGWGRVCGRWKVSRHRPAGRLLTTDLKQSRAREVCIEASPQCPPAASLLPAWPQLQKTFSKGCQVAGGLTPRGDPEVEPLWTSMQTRELLARAAQSRDCLSQWLGWPRVQY